RQIMTYPAGADGRRSLGAWGEEAAARFLERRGWAILDRGFRADRKEIDLVARRGEVVAFVEVKTRSSSHFAAPQEAVGARKRAGITGAAAAWAAEHGEPNMVYRFDAIAVTRSATGSPRIEHIEDAWGI